MMPVCYERMAQDYHGLVKDGVPSRRQIGGRVNRVNNCGYLSQVCRTLADLIGLLVRWLCVQLAEL